MQNLFVQIIRELILDSNWGVLVTLKDSSKKFPNDDLLLFSRVVSEFAAFKQAAAASCWENYLQARENMPPELGELLDELLVIDEGEEKEIEEKESTNHQ